MLTMLFKYIPIDAVLRARGDKAVLGGGVVRKD
jgi:hypothetical protein